MASWQGRAVRAAQPATALAGPLLALLVLLVCSSQASAEGPPDEGKPAPMRDSLVVNPLQSTHKTTWTLWNCVLQTLLI